MEELSVAKLREAFDKLMADAPEDFKPLTYHALPAEIDCWEWICELKSMGLQIRKRSPIPSPRSDSKPKP